MSKFIKQDETPPEEIEAVIEKVANFIVRRYELQDLALLFLETNVKIMSPLYRPYGELARFHVTPFQPLLGMLGGDALELSALKYINIFQDKKNVERLIQKIKETAEEVEKEKQKKQENDSLYSYLRKIKSRLKNLIS